MRTKSHLLSAGQTRNPVKSPVHHILLAVALVLLCCIAVPQNVQANIPVPKIDMGKKTTYTVGLTWYRTGDAPLRNNYDIYSDILTKIMDTYKKDYQKAHPGCSLTDIYNACKKALKNLTLKNTKPSVLKASLTPDYIAVELKKAGKTTITVKGKLGKTKVNLKINITSYKYDRPFTSFKVNGKSYKDAFKIFRDYYFFHWNASIRPLKLQLKLKKGWTIKKANASSDDVYWDMVKKTSTVMDFKLVSPKNDDTDYAPCMFVLYNKNNNQTIGYKMFFNML